jgi:hypothetical protein
MLMHLPFLSSTHSLPKALAPLPPSSDTRTAADHKGFFDAAAVDKELLRKGAITGEPNPLSPPASPPVRPKLENWFRVSLVPETPETYEEFVLHIPDHLPNSPLCPKHPKHKSKGRGRCPAHGRNRTSEDTLSEEEEPRQRKKKDLKRFL